MIACAAAPLRAQESEREIRSRALAAASHADAVALLVGRLVVEKRWNELVDAMMYRVAPRGTWDARDPAWVPARRALAKALQHATVARFEASTRRWVHDVVLEHYLDPLTDDERRSATAFFESPGGHAWLASREAFLEERGYGLPYRDETEPYAAYERRKAAASKTLLHLPVEQTNAVYEFTNSLGEKLLKAQNGIVADVLRNVLSSDMDAAALESQKTVVEEVRARVPGVPPASDKTYLGTVTMQTDRGLEVVVEQWNLYRRAGTYAFHYGPGALHWNDVADALPGLAPGETRNLYRDPKGRLSDHP